MKTVYLHTPPTSMMFIDPTPRADLPTGNYNIVKEYANGYVIRTINGELVKLDKSRFS